MTKKTLLKLILLLGSLAACQPLTRTPTLTAAPTITAAPIPTRTLLSLVPSWTPTLSPTPSPVPSSTTTLTPAPTNTPTLSPTPRPVPLLEPVIELSASQLADPANEVLHDLILFTSDISNPFPPRRLSLDGTQNIVSYPQLWGISPDGARTGRLTPGDKDFAAYFPTDAAAKPLLVAYGVHFNNQAVQSIQLPGECYGLYPQSEAASVAQMGDQPCSAFQFSADGRTLGFFFGPQICGQGLILLDTQTGQTLLRSALGGNHGFEFLPTGKLLLASGHCEGGDVRLVDLASQTAVTLGAEGANFWSDDHRVLVVFSMPYGGAESVLWGYNVTTDKLFLPEPETWQMDDHLLWAPDGQTFLYQHRPLSRSADQSAYNFSGPRQILRVDPQTGKQTVLASDPSFDYDLCAGEYSDCDTWLGDWVQVRRFPFSPQTIPFGENFFSDTRVTCLKYGANCPVQPELFALNWRTGELLPWEQAPLPSPTPTLDAVVMEPTQTPTPTPAPDLSRAPIYTAPSGGYAFYVGTDGHSLWLVPADGEPELWVRQGTNFFYLP